MARLFDDGSSQSLSIASSPVTGLPITLSMWGNSNDDAASQRVLLVGESTDYVSITMEGTVSDQIWAHSRGAIGTYNAVTASGFTANTWHHLCGVFTSTTSRAVFIDGGSKGTNATDCGAISTLNKVLIGVSNFTSAYMSGGLAEAAIWNAALTDAEAAILATGISPLAVRPQSLVFYCPLVRDNDEDLIGGLSLTANNGPTISAHPPIYYPVPAHIFQVTSAVGDLSASETDDITIGESIDADLSIGIEIEHDDPAYQITGVRIQS